MFRCFLMGLIVFLWTIFDYYFFKLKYYGKGTIDRGN